MTADDRDVPQIHMGSADRCPTCKAEMTPDQRYCVECGARRGQPRFGLDRSPSEGGEPVRAAGPAPSAIRRISSGGTLLAGLAVLLLAMGVGVMIGQNSGNGPTLAASAAGKPFQITVNSTGSGGGTGSGTSAAGTSGSGSASSKSGGGKSGGSKSSSSKSSGSKNTSHPSSSSVLNGQAGPTVNTKNLKTKAQQKQAVKKITGTQVQLNNGKKLAPGTQSMGGSCSNGTVGCNNGKYDGTFFSGG